MYVFFGKLSLFPSRLVIENDVMVTHTHGGKSDLHVNSTTQISLHGFSHTGLVDVFTVAKHKPNQPYFSWRLIKKSKS